MKSSKFIVILERSWVLKSLLFDIDLGVFNEIIIVRHLGKILEFWNDHCLKYEIVSREILEFSIIDNWL